MKLVSWNVNGLRACLSHGFAESFAALDADVFCLQETKMQPGQADFHPEGYESISVRPSARDIRARPATAASSRCR